MDDILKTPEVEAAISSLKRLATERGAAFEIFYSLQKGTSVEVESGAVDSFKVRSSSGIALRTIKADRAGFGYSSALSEDALSRMVDEALAGSEAVGEDAFNTFPVPGGGDQSLDEGSLVDPAYFERSEADKIETARVIEESALGFDEKIARVRKASYSETLGASRIVNSEGVDSGHRATYFSGSVAAVAEEGSDSQIAWEVDMGHGVADVDARSVGERAAERAVSLLGAREMATIKCGAVIENAVAMDLLGTLAASFLADNVTKGRSMLSGLVGKDVVSKVINIIDDGTLAGGWSTSAVDGEGSPRQRTSLVEGGRLKGYLYDAYWAKRLKASSTGNSSRGGYKGVPSVGVSNFYIEEGSGTLEELLKDMDKGLFITDLMGVHTVNGVTGEFSLGAQGFWVEGGAPAYPVRGIAVSGTLLGLLSKVEVIGGDMRFMGSVGSPSLLLSEIEVSGT